MLRVCSPCLDNNSKHNIVDISSITHSKFGNSMNKVSNTSIVYDNSITYTASSSSLWTNHSSLLCTNHCKNSCYNKVFKKDVHLVNSSVETFVVSVVQSTPANAISFSLVWNQRLGHPSFQTFQQLM